MFLTTSGKIFFGSLALAAAAEAYVPSPASHWIAGVLVWVAFTTLILGMNAMNKVGD